MNKPDKDLDAPKPSADQQPLGAAAARPTPLRCAKIQDCHLQQLAIVYVRQSTPQQVLEHRESRERQYALADHAATLGWPKDRILVIDDDQGHSGKSADHRDGFHRLLAEVTMNHVGLVLGLEMSRLARSNKDWHHLLEVCAVFGTLLADQDGVYDPRDSNDRLLLGLKGTMSEFELVTMRNRLERGKLNKAERGELFISVPFGYVKLPTGEVVLDPDEQVRSVVTLIFDKFDELGSLYALFHYLIRNDIRLGMRARSGPQFGQVVWHRPSLPTLSQMFRHPIYAGAYAFGRRPLDRKRTSVRTGQGIKSWVPMDQWKVLKRDCLPAYISWERYLANRGRLEQNRSRPGTLGTARRGPTLLSGLVTCGSCGRHLQTSYHRTGNAYYNCVRHLLEGTEPICCGVKAAVVDDVVAEQVLRALAPAGLEASLQALANIQNERVRLDRHWQQQLERARYEAERAERQFAVVEPENRLVARTLEQRWEEALRRHQQVQEDYDRFLLAQPARLTDQERAQILALANDMPALWQAPATTAADRKEMVRCLVERVVVDVRRDSEVVGVTIHWRGGFTSRHPTIRPVKWYEQMEGFEQLMERIVQLRQQGQTSAGIAAKLNDEGYRTPKKRGAFSKELVRKLLSRRGLTNERSDAEQLTTKEWWLADLGRALGVSVTKLRDWILRGWLHGRQTAPQKLWIAWADGDELKRLRKLKARSERGVVCYPEELTTPKKRKNK